DLAARDVHAPVLHHPCGAEGLERRPRGGGVFKVLLPVGGRDRGDASGVIAHPTYSSVLWGAERATLKPARWSDSGGGRDSRGAGLRRPVRVGSASAWRLTGPCGTPAGIELRCCLRWLVPAGVTAPPAIERIIELQHPGEQLQRACGILPAALAQPGIKGVVEDRRP